MHLPHCPLIGIKSVVGACGVYRPLVSRIEPSNCAIAIDGVVLGSIGVTIGLADWAENVLVSLVILIDLLHILLVEFVCGGSVCLVHGRVFREEGLLEYVLSLGKRACYA